MRGRNGLCEDAFDTLIPVRRAWISDEVADDREHAPVVVGVVRESEGVVDPRGMGDDRLLRDARQPGDRRVAPELRDEPEDAERRG